MTDVIVSASDDVIVTSGPDDDVAVTADAAAVIESPNQGPPGPSGPANALAIGTVTTGAAGSAAAASITGTPPSQVLDLTIPRGDKGDPGAAGNTVLYGTGAPGAGIGVDGNFYIATDTHTFYGPKASGTWPAGVSMTGPAGPAGAAGNTILYGTGAPGAGTGVDGNFYIATDTHTFYGPKASGTWPAGVSMTGPAGPAGAAGNTILYGTGTPGSGTGVDGNFYIDLSSYTLSGPKASGTWPGGVSLSAGHRNRIDNSWFAVSQRYGYGAIISLNGTSDYTYVVDRWFAWGVGSAGSVCGYYQTKDGAAYPYAIYLLRCNRSGSPACIGQRFSADQISDLVGETVTLTVGYVSTIADTLTWAVYHANSLDTFGTRAAPTKTLIASGSWSIPSSGGGTVVAPYSASCTLPVGAGYGIEIQLVGTATTGAAHFSKMKLEWGPIATRWEPLPPSVDLAECQRRYFRIKSDAALLFLGSGALGVTAATAAIAFKYPQPMAAKPILGFSNLEVGNGLAGGAVTSLSGSVCGLDRAYLSVACAAIPGGVGGQSAYLMINPASGYIEGSCDL